MQGGWQDVSKRKHDLTYLSLRAEAHACRLPLGMPSKLRQRALDLAERLIRTPGSTRPDGQGAEREAGYIILGALCASGLPKGQKVNGLQFAHLMWATI